jgi:elongator complex protein 2
MPQVAAVPVLGLSNKEGASEPNGTPAEDLRNLNLATNGPLNGEDPLASLGHPPSEDVLSRHTLWPEREKLYGHGFEVSALAVSHDSSIIATACKASSTEHAVIRLYDTSTWQVVKPALTAHSLTVTCLAFSEEDEFLVSGGRDRKWAVFERAQPNTPIFALKNSNSKGHSRMILDVSWIRSQPRPTFATAGRDKCVKIWARENTEFTCCSTVDAVAPVTSIHFCTLNDKRTLLGACGLETGALLIHAWDPVTLEVIKTLELGER